LTRLPHPVIMGHPANKPHWNPAMFTDSTGVKQNGILKVRYSHDAMIDQIIANPTIQQNQLAIMFDRTPGWISVVINSDAFQARLAERKEEIIDPVLRATIEEKFKAAAHASLDRVLEKLSGPLPPTDDFLLNSLKIASSALGYGARERNAGPQVAVQINLPGRIASSGEWAAAHAAPALPVTPA
jgi:hypothetical protein